MSLFVNPTITFALVLTLTIAFAPLADAKTQRSSHAKTEFKKQHPCPANGSSKGSCKGYVIDHVKPLSCGGADAPHNMQWQTKADAKAKDKWERQGC